MSRSPVGKVPPVLAADGSVPAGAVDPLPQALILTAIVIGFAVQAFLLTLLVLTWRRNRTVNLDELEAEDPVVNSDPAAPSSAAPIDQAVPAGDAR